MKIFTHWVYDPDKEQHTKAFFATKTERMTATTKARGEGKQVVAEFEWPVEPTAKGLADFCKDQMVLREYKEYPEDGPTKHSPKGEKEFKKLYECEFKPDEPEEASIEDML